MDRKRNRFNGAVKRPKQAGGDDSRQRQFWDYRTRLSIRAPVSVHNYGEWHSFQAGTDRQREAHVADHDIRAKSADQPAILLDVTPKHVGGEHRLTSCDVL